MQKKRVMILGGSGSLGGYLVGSFRSLYDVVCPLPRGSVKTKDIQGVSWANTALDVRNTAVLVKLLDETRPDVIINCIAITPRSRDFADHRICMQVNGDFPHRLAEAADRTSSYVIHLSTDAVFSGRKGHYCEADRPDPIDFYGHTKLHGELVAAHCVTLRTTFYGIFHTCAGLLQSFLSSSPNQWHGYANYVFSAVSAKSLADVIGQLVYRDDRLHGIYHVAGEPISKLEFLELVRDFLGMHGQIVPVEEPVIDRSLDSSRFWDAIDRYLPSQRQMIDAMGVELLRALKSLALRPAMRRMIT